MMNPGKSNAFFEHAVDRNSMKEMSSDSPERSTGEVRELKVEVYRNGSTGGAAWRTGSLCKHVLMVTSLSWYLGSPVVHALSMRFETASITDNFHGFFVRETDPIGWLVGLVALTSGTWDRSKDRWFSPTVYPGAYCRVFELEINGVEQEMRKGLPRGGSRPCC
jgi:hypothetical protein